MPSDVRQLLADAAAAEARGDKPSAIVSLRKAAELYRDANNPSRAMKMLKHIRRLEGVDDEGAFGGGEGFTVLEGGAAGEHTAARRVPRVLEERAPTLASAELAAWCSFCCRPTADVGQLVAGPTGCFICQGCVGVSHSLLGGQTVAKSAAPARARAAGDFTPLQAQHAAWARLVAGSSRLTLLLGPQGSGKTTLLRALEAHGEVATLDVDRALTPHDEDALVSKLGERRVVLAVRAEAPQPALTLSGEAGVEALYDTPSLATACVGLVSEAVLGRVDAVVVLPGLDLAALDELAGVLVAARGDGLKLPARVRAQVAALADQSGRGAHELAALIARIPTGQWA